MKSEGVTKVNPEGNVHVGDDFSNNKCNSTEIFYSKSQIYWENLSRDHQSL